MSMITIEMMGGLGNHLFQIACVLSYSLKNKKTFYFEDKLPTRNDRPFYWDNLLSSLKIFLKPSIRLPIYKEPQFHYTPIPYIEESFKLWGYFQSYKYFKEHEQSIFRLLKIRETQQKYSPTNKVSLHFRIGDYKDIQEHHPLLTMDYYKNAMKQLIRDTQKDNWNILYFFEEKDASYVNEYIDQLKKNYPKLTFESVDHNLKDWEQMIQMSLCKHNIIANSSFSWWGAYLNPFEPNVYYPKQWFGPAQGNKSMKDLFPSHWSLIR